jgi:hypothetical protein
MMCSRACYNGYVCNTQTGHCEPPTGGTGGSLGCADLLNCVASCSDQTCADDCRNMGSSSGRSAFDALNSCLDQACSSPCGPGGSDSSCQSCAHRHCSREVNACQ